MYHKQVLLAEPEDELESALPAGSPRDLAALMEYYGEAAATAGSDAEAEAFLGAMVPIATRMVAGRVSRTAARRLVRHVPKLKQAVRRVGRSLRRRGGRRGRRLMRIMPTVVRRSARSLARLRHRRLLPAGRVVRMVSRHTKHILRNPRRKTILTRHKKKRARLVNPLRARHARLSCRCRLY